MPPTLPIWTPGPPGRAVVVAPHPDDEVFGVGGILHDLGRTGWTLDLVAVTDGEGAFGAAPGRDQLAGRRRQEQRRALHRLGLDEITVHRLGLPDGQLDHHGAAIAAGVRAVAAGADWLLTTWRHDGHPDHEATGRAVAVVAAGCGIALAEYPVWGWRRLPRARQWRWPLGDVTSAAKHAAMAAFASQLEPSPHGPPVVPAALVDRWRRADEVLLT
jgi:LmbE family N-acetylglucosaminyl deacetylase